MNARAERPWIGRVYLEEEAAAQSSPSPLSMVKGPEYPHSKARDAREAESIEALGSLVRGRRLAGFSRDEVIRFVTDKVTEFWEGTISTEKHRCAEAVH